MSFNIEQMAAGELDALIAAAEERKKALHRERLHEVRNRLIQMAKDEGYTIEELFGGVSKTKPAGTKGRKVAPKYRHPSDPSMTWTGRGKQPRWMEAVLKSGKTLQDLEIQ